MSRSKGPSAKQKPPESDPFRDPNRSERLDREEPRGKLAPAPDQRKHPDDTGAQERAEQQNQKRPERKQG